MAPDLLVQWSNHGVSAEWSQVRTLDRILLPFLSDFTIYDTHRGPRGVIAAGGGFWKKFGAFGASLIFLTVFLHFSSLHILSADVLIGGSSL
eukprot:809561-Prorocentrum_minimum.AAC.1